MVLASFIGFMRALGLQGNVAMTTIAIFYLLSIPLAIYLAFANEFVWAFGGFGWAVIFMMIFFG